MSVQIKLGVGTGKSSSIYKELVDQLWQLSLRIHSLEANKPPSKHVDRKEALGSLR